MFPFIQFNFMIIILHVKFIYKKCFILYTYHIHIYIDLYCFILFLLFYRNFCTTHHSPSSFYIAFSSRIIIIISRGYII